MKKHRNKPIKVPRIARYALLALIGFGIGFTAYEYFAPPQKPQAQQQSYQHSPIVNNDIPHNQPEAVIVSPPQEEIKQEVGVIKDTIQDRAITHKNCLIRCPFGTATDNIVVDHDAIILSSNRNTKFADWVAYQVTPANIDGPERKRNWAKDPKIDVQFTFTPEDYKGMSKEPYFFDRGHQAPLAAFKNHPNWHVVNYLSNITPQKKGLNRGPWKNLESAERKLVSQYREAYVLTGPYYDKNNVISAPPIERIKYIVPSGYWKIIAVKEGGNIKTASFIFSQNAPIGDSYCKYLANVSQVEQMTGLKFFNGKPSLRETALKNEIGCALNVESVKKALPKSQRNSRTKSQALQRQRERVAS